MTRALVLGGGGVTGIAWELGVIAGLADCGVDLARAEVFVGTSAGSVVGVQLAHEVPLARLVAEQRRDDTGEAWRPYSQVAADEQNRKLVAKVNGDLIAARRRIGAFALRSSTPPIELRRAIIRGRLPAETWPARTLRVVAVDAATGLERVFDAASGVDVVDAVMASCAVPGTWPPVVIGEAHYIDGGIRSMTNADLAQDADCIVVLSPFGYSDGNPISGQLRREVAALQARSIAVAVVEPDAEALVAIGDNVLDPARRAPSLDAGLAQGRRLAAGLAPLWS